MSPKSKIAASILPQSRFNTGRFAAEAFSHATTAMAIVADDLRLLECNNRFLKEFSQSGHRGDPASLARYLSKDDHWKISTLIDQSLAEENMQLKTVEISEGAMQVHFQPLHTAEGGQFLLCFIPRSQAERKLDEARQRLLMVVEGVSVGLVVIEADSDLIIDINNQALELFGRTREEMRGRTCQQFISQECEDNGFEALNGGLLLSGNRMLRAADGQQRPVAFSVKRSHFRGRDYFLVSITDISCQHSAEQQVSRLANYDATTGLPNRHLLLDRLQQASAWARRMQGSVALLLLDIDNFKDFNDSLGHSSGDRLLMMLAERLKGCVRRSDTVARVGGDEFAVVLTDIGSEQQVAVVARKILACLSEPCVIDGRQYHVTASLGISSCPEDAQDPDDLIRLADTAMYRAKKAGRNQFQFFSPEMNKDALQRLLLTNDLYQALAEEQFEVYYQPQVDMRSGSICGTEALLRWNHPTLGMIPPDQFIPLAEETGLIVELGQWVLETACRQVRKWQCSLMLPLRLAVNLSAVQFRQPDLAKQVDIVLQKTKFSAALLELELTETMLMEQVEKAQQAMEKLKKMGITLAIDDFGTGFSSLSYLKHFPIDRLKIDRSFVKELAENPADAAIVEAIIAMAGRLGHEIIAEGVEEEAQAEFLFANGCYEIQGFFFGRPLPAAEFTLKLQNQVGSFRAFGNVRPASCPQEPTEVDMKDYGLE